MAVVQRNDEVGRRTVPPAGESGRVALTAARDVSMLLGISADEGIPVWHLDLRQRIFVHSIVLADDLIERENVGGQRIDFVIGQRLWLRPRHGAPRKVEDRRRVRHIGRHRAFPLVGRAG